MNINKTQDRRRKDCIRRSVRMLILTAIALSFLSHATLQAVAAQEYQTADHVVISEIYHASLAREAQFIELYNPTGQYINISGWAIQTELNDRSILFPGGEIIEVDVFLGIGEIIPAYGYYLIAGEEWDTWKDQPSWPAADYRDRFFMGKTSQYFMDSGVILRDNSYQRRPADEGDGLQGNGIDTDNNYEDFVILKAEPQNSLSTPEIPPGTTRCNTQADTDCDGSVSNIELALYADLWYTGQGVTNIDLALAAQAWYQG